MRKHLATILGFLIAPLFAVIVLLAADMMRKDHLKFIDTLGWVPIFYCYTLGVTLIIGLPAYLLLSHFNKVMWWSAILGGTFCGAVTWIIVNALTPLVIVVGVLSGLVFWLIWKQAEVRSI